MLIKWYVVGIYKVIQWQVICNTSHKCYIFLTVETGFHFEKYGKMEREIDSQIEAIWQKLKCQPIGEPKTIW